MKVFLYARYVQKDFLVPLQQLLKSIENMQWGIAMSPNLSEFVVKKNISVKYDIISSYEELSGVAVDMVITLGGDGTILGATCLIRDLEIPIIGINLGRLGFLASVEPKKIDKAMELIATKAFRIEERSMLCLDSDNELFGNNNFALNDFAVHKRDTSSMITIHTYIDGEFLNSYWADGLIIATPTGSTGYSLSCGGPIVFPSSGNMVLTPVAPHNLTVRPLVISDNSVISVTIEGRARKFLCTLDSRYETITAKHKLSIRKSDFNTKLVILEGQSFLQTIHEKLSWGTDRRN